MPSAGSWLRKPPRFSRNAAIVALALIGAFGAVPSPQRAVPSADQIARRAGEYVRKYQNEFRFLVADETSIQRIVVPARPDGAPSQMRTTRGEMFITFLDAPHHWSAVHDVMEVDGVAVLDRVDPATLLQQDDFRSAAARVLAENARFNIGRVRRNFNDPMLALLLFDPERRSRSRYSRTAIEEPGMDVRLATLSFRERDRPTLVHDYSGRPVFASGEAIIDADSGVVRHTTIAFKDEDIHAELKTEFAWQEKVQLWVPTLFSERYSKGNTMEVTVSESRYTNYRRFEVTGRLLPAR
jgi:hypothetical protein